MGHKVDASKVCEVLAVKRRVLEDLDCLNEFSTDVGMLPIVISKAFFIDRCLIEDDTSYKQLIPYVVLMLNDTILTYTRRRGAESRLHDLVSFGFGGHVTKSDLGEDNLINTKTLWRAARREVLEETGIFLRLPSNPVALINEDVSQVGRVHLGIVYLAKVGKALAEPSLAIECAHLKLLSVKELCSIENREPWSKILAKNLIGMCI